MNGTLIKGAAAAVALGLAMAPSGTAKAQVAGQYCNPNGATTTIVSGGYRNYYRCVNNRWVFEKSCPIAGGPCRF